MEWLGFHGAGVCGGEVLIGYLWYLLLRIFPNGEQFRLW
jgi:hypothetical protein